MNGARAADACADAFFHNFLVGGTTRGHFGFAQQSRIHVPIPLNGGDRRDYVRKYIQSMFQTLIY